MSARSIDELLDEEYSDLRKIEQLKEEISILEQAPDFEEEFRTEAQLIEALSDTEVIKNLVGATTPKKSKITVLRSLLVFVIGVSVAGAATKGSENYDLQMAAGVLLIVISMALGLWVAVRAVRRIIAGGIKIVDGTASKNKEEVRKFKNDKINVLTQSFEVRIRDSKYLEGSKCSLSNFKVKVNERIEQINEEISQIVKKYPAI